MNEPIQAMAARARSAYHDALAYDEAGRARAIRRMADYLQQRREQILQVNATEVATARSSGASDALCDRLSLRSAHIAGLVASLQEIAASAPVLGVVQNKWNVASNGLEFVQQSIPLGVIGMIYEARPGVTVDAAALCIKSGNAVILRGGSECFATNRLLVDIVREALQAADFPPDLVQMVRSTDRSMVDAMLAAYGDIDVLIPRGGKSLTEKVAREARMPTILHLTGNCHTYVHHSADFAQALTVTLNAKMRRTSVCGATESVLIDAAIAPVFLPMLVDALQAKGCEVRGCEASCRTDVRMHPASEDDWGKEYLDAVVSVKIVTDVAEATAHINRYGSHHTDAILASDAEVISAFTRDCDSAIVMVNASTQFADGGEFGFGGEIGIATGRMPPRGPVAALGLTTYKYIVRGHGSVRP